MSHNIRKTFKKKQPQSVKYQNFNIFFIEGELYYLTHHLQIYKHLLKVTHDKLFSWLLPIVTPNVKIFFFLFNLPSFLCMTVSVSGQINCTFPHHIFFFLLLDYTNSLLIFFSMFAASLITQLIQIFNQSSFQWSEGVGKRTERYWLKFVLPLNILDCL